MNKHVNGFEKLAGCKGKKGFLTFEHAKQVVNRRTDHRRGGEPYRCRYCQMWHVGGKGGSNGR